MITDVCDNYLKNANFIYFWNKLEKEAIRVAIGKRLLCLHSRGFSIWLNWLEGTPLCVYTLEKKIILSGRFKVMLLSACVAAIVRLISPRLLRSDGPASARPSVLSAPLRTDSLYRSCVSVDGKRTPGTLGSNTRCGDHQNVTALPTRFVSSCSETF